MFARTTLFVRQLYIYPIYIEYRLFFFSLSTFFFLSLSIFPSTYMTNKLYDAAGYLLLPILTNDLFGISLSCRVCVCA